MERMHGNLDLSVGTELEPNGEAGKEASPEKSKTILVWEEIANILNYDTGSDNGKMPGLKDQCFIGNKEGKFAEKRPEMNGTRWPGQLESLSNTNRNAHLTVRRGLI